MKIDLRIGNDIYKIGNAINGEVLIETNGEIYHDGIFLELLVKEKTQMEYLKERIKEIRKETYSAYKEEKLIIDPGVISAGTTRLPFTMNLPDNLPESYEGTMGTIEYTLRVSCRHLQRDSIAKELKLTAHAEDSSDSIFTQSYISKYVTMEHDSHSIYPGGIFRGRFSLKEFTNYRTMMIELVHIEEVSVDEKINRSRRILSRWDIGNRNVFFNEWMGFDFSVPKEIPNSVEGSLISSKLYVDVSIHTSYNREILFRIPVKVKRT